MRITAFNYSADTFLQAEEFYLQELKQREEALGPNHVQVLPYTTKCLRDP